MQEFQRIIRRDTPLPIHDPDIDTPVIYFTYTDFVPWRERARRLMRLTSRAYIFDDTGWNSQWSCWRGVNSQTNAVVLLRCSDTMLSDGEMASFIGYANRFESERREPVEPIVAIEGEQVQEIHGRQLRVETESRLLDGLVDWSDYRAHVDERFFARNVNRFPPDNRRCLCSAMRYSSGS